MQSNKAYNVHLNAEIGAGGCVEGLTVTTTKATSCATSSRMLFAS